MDTILGDHNVKTYSTHMTLKEEAHIAHMVAITSLHDSLMFRADIALGAASGTTILQYISLVVTIDLSITTNNDALPLFAVTVFTHWVEIMFALTVAIAVALAVALKAASAVDIMAEQILVIAAQVTAIVTALTIAPSDLMLAIKADQDVLAIVAARSTEQILQDSSRV